MQNATTKMSIDDTVAVARSRFDYLRLTFCDIHGISRHLLVARRHFEHNIKNGAALYAGK